MPAKSGGAAVVDLVEDQVRAPTRQERRHQQPRLVARPVATAYLQDVRDGHQAAHEVEDGGVDLGRRVVTATGRVDPHHGALPRHLRDKGLTGPAARERGQDEGSTSSSCRIQPRRAEGSGRRLGSAVWRTTCRSGCGSSAAP